MSDIDIRVTGRAGRITFTRTKALNAMSYDMCMAIDAALRAWREDDAVALVVIDAEGEKAFCAGGDIAELYDTGTKGDYDYGRTFWRDEYRTNALIFEYPKPIVSFMQGFTMGGGVGIGCHGSHRVVGESSKIAMPEVGIGLVPDVGGTLMLALAPGRLGEYLGLTAGRMGPDDAIYAGFADHFIPQAGWHALIAQLEETGNAALVEQAAAAAPEGELRDLQDDIDRHFAGESLGDILTSLRGEDGEFSAKILSHLTRNSPLSMACTVEMLHRLRGPGLSIRKALDLEYRFTHRAMEQGDFLEGIRAQIIDKDRNPQWQYADMNVPAVAVSQMLQPLGAGALSFQED
jgi:enoyl-CoA hydratase/carnithine racemase